MSLPNGAKKVKTIFHFISHHISGARPDLDEYRRHECKVEERWAKRLHGFGSGLSMWSLADIQILPEFVFRNESDKLFREPAHMSGHFAYGMSRKSSWSGVRPAQGCWFD